MFSVILASSLLTFTSEFGTLDKSELEWAFREIDRIVSGTEPLVVLPTGIRIEFPEERYEGYTITRTGVVDWYNEVVPFGGIIFVKKDWNFGSIYDRAILIHEAAHILDMKTKRGARCDPYRLQYHYMYENGYTIEQIKLLYSFTFHDPSRKCHLRMNTSALKDYSKPHRLP